MSTKFTPMSGAGYFSGKRFTVKALAVKVLFVAGSGHAQVAVDSPIIPNLSVAAQWHELALEVFEIRVPDLQSPPGSFFSLIPRCTLR